MLKKFDSKRTILIVDDDGDVRSFLAEYLREVDSLQILTAGDAAEAVAIVSRTPELDAVLTDFRMPKATGLDFLSELHSMSLNIPVVMLSAYAEVSVFRQAIRLGAVDFLEKPIDRQDLIESVRRATEIGYATRRLIKWLRETSPEALDQMNQLAMFRHILNTLPLSQDSAESSSGEDG